MSRSCLEEFERCCARRGGGIGVRLRWAAVGAVMMLAFIVAQDDREGGERPEPVVSRGDVLQG